MSGKGNPHDIALNNIEKHLGDVVNGDDGPETIYEEAYILAFDAIVDAGWDSGVAASIAADVAANFGTPN